MTKLGKALFVIFLLVLALTGCASRNSESKYKDLRRLIPEDYEEQIEELLRAHEGKGISLEGTEDLPSVLANHLGREGALADYEYTLLQLLLLPSDYDICFYDYRDCRNLACTDPSHYHWCTKDCDNAGHYHNLYQDFMPSKGCEDVLCTDPDHYHWCPYGCKEPEHGHLPYQWKYFE